MIRAWHCERAAVLVIRAFDRPQPACQRVARTIHVRSRGKRNFLVRIVAIPVGIVVALRDPRSGDRLIVVQVEHEQRRGRRPLGREHDAGVQRGGKGRASLGGQVVQRVLDTHVRPRHDGIAIGILPLPASELPTRFAHGLAEVVAVGGIGLERARRLRQCLIGLFARVGIRAVVQEVGNVVIGRDVDRTRGAVQGAERAVLSLHVRNDLCRRRNGVEHGVLRYGLVHRVDRRVHGAVLLEHPGDVCRIARIIDLNLRRVAIDGIRVDVAQVNRKTAHGVGHRLARGDLDVARTLVALRQLVRVAKRVLACQRVGVGFVHAFEFHLVRRAHPVAVQRTFRSGHREAAGQLHGVGVGRRILIVPTVPRVTGDRGFGRSGNAEVCLVVHGRRSGLRRLHDDAARVRRFEGPFVIDVVLVAVVIDVQHVGRGIG